MYLYTYLFPCVSIMLKHNDVYYCYLCIVCFHIQQQLKTDFPCAKGLHASQLMCKAKDSSDLSSYSNIKKIPS